MSSKPKLVTLDFETYYDTDYSLTKLTTEQYVRDPRFEIIGVSYKIDDEPARWYSLPSLDAYAKLLAPLKNHFVVCHNTAFDGAILGWRLGIHPKFLFDTLSMARPENQMTVGGSLKALSDKYTVGQKGTEVIKALGKRLADFTPAELEEYGNYCKNDVELTYLLFHILKDSLPVQELKVIDMMLRMYTQPKLVLDKSLLINHLDAVEKRKEKLMDIVGAVCGQDELMSNNKLAEVLRKLGVEPPTKLSPRTGKETFAFGKTDVAFKALLEHENDVVQAVVSARLGVKSTLEETRTRAFIDIAERGPLPIMLNYYGAHTGRASGGDKINLQNLPRGGALRKAIRAPEGFRLIACDSAQIEARVVAWLAGQENLVEDFARGEDIYSKFASMVYGRTITKSEHKIERHVGKTCFSGDTLVVTSRGTLRIVDVQPTDMLWDGESWVSHDGLVDKGMQETLRLAGVDATPEHEILTEHGWREWSEVHMDRSLFQSALSLGSSPYCVTSDMFQVVAGATDTSQCASVRVGGKGSLIETTLNTAGLRVATLVQRLHLALNGTGSTRTLSKMTSTAQGCLTALHRQLLDAIAQAVKCISTTDSEAFRCARNGEITGPRSYAMLRPYQNGTTISSTWTASTSMETTSPATYGSSVSQITPKTSAALKCSNDGSRSLRRVYDIANAGPRHRFTVITSNGPILVHNCILGLGYGMGNEKFRTTLKTGNPSVDIPADEARRIVYLYRDTYPYIKKLWYAGGDALHSIRAGRKYAFGRNGLLTTTDTGILLPNGMQVRYPNLTSVQNEFVYTRDPRQVAAWTTMRLTGEWDLDKLSRIYGGKVIENVVQALARIVVFDQMAAINRKYRVVLTVHDEVVCLVPEDEVDEAKAFMLEEMSKAPVWAPGLPIACEASIGTSYGEAK